VLSRNLEQSLHEAFSQVNERRHREALAHDLARLISDAEAFRERYQGRLANLTPAALDAAGATHDRLQEQRRRVVSYAALVRASNVVDPKIDGFLQMVQEGINAVSIALRFFTRELDHAERVSSMELDQQTRVDLFERSLNALKRINTFVPEFVHQLLLLLFVTWLAVVGVIDVLGHLGVKLPESIISPAPPTHLLKRPLFWSVEGEPLSVTVMAQIAFGPIEFK
jgi:oligoendopeptidase F